MERTIYGNSRFAAVEEDGRLVEYIPVAPEEASGRILRGKVHRIMTGLDCAFVDIGRKKDGFLPLQENSKSFQGGAVRSGDSLLVQIRKEETGEKGAFLSRDLTIPGSYMLLMPLNRHIGVSARIAGEETRKRLRETGARLAEGRFGLVMRAAAAEAEEETLREEMASLLAQWEAIERGELSAETAAERLAAELKRDYGPRGIDRIREGEDLPPDLRRQLKEAENRTIRLPHGGNIAIDRCEAMTVIDINSGGDPGDGNRRETILRTNLEACREIMIQTRLRNLSGILILDMIDMENGTDRERVLEALGEAFREDRVKTVIHGYTALGLIEMTRKRSRTAWQEQRRE